MEIIPFLKSLLALVPALIFMAIMYYANKVNIKRRKERFLRENPEYYTNELEQEQQNSYNSNFSDSQEEEDFYDDDDDDYQHVDRQITPAYCSYKPIDDISFMGGGLMKTFDSETTESMADEYNKRVAKMVASFAAPAFITESGSSLEIAEPIEAVHRNSEGLYKTNNGELLKDFSVKKAIIFSEILAPKFLS